MRLSVVVLTVVALMAVAVMPLHIALAQQANPTRILPDSVHRGETFNVTITFTAPANRFDLIYLFDAAPDDWVVVVNGTWCVPNATAHAEGNSSKSTWWTGPYGNGTAFTVVYKVTVPHDAQLGIHSFAGMLRYYLGPNGPYGENITGASQLGVVLRSEISFSPSNLSFIAVAGGANPANQILEIWNSGEGTLNWTLSDDAAWLSEIPMSGNSTGGHDNVTVAANVTGMSAGNYTANITISAAEANNTPQVVPVSLHISPPPGICFSPSNLSFSAVEGGADPANETLEIWNSGGGTLNWTLGDDAAWLSEIPMSGNSTGGHDNVTVAADITGMSAGNYSANITISASGANNTPQVVPVSLHISPPPGISFSPANLNFSAVEGGANPANERLEIWNSGGGMLNWTLGDDAAWLSEIPMSGNSTGEHDNVTVAADITGMSAGNYSANITISASGANNTPQVVPVSLHISPATGISFSPASLSFSATEGSSNPANKTLKIWNSGGGMLNWTLSDDAAWLSESPIGGNSTGPSDETSVAVSVNITGMSVGDRTANITISAAGANNTPQVVPVDLHIKSPGGGGGGGGGGAGGGGSYYLAIDILGKITRVKMSYGTSETLKATVASDFNNTNFVEIECGTTVICDDTNKAPEVLMMRVANQSPPVPDGSVIVGSVYNFTGNYGYQGLEYCSGVSFDQNITIVLSYDPNDLPESTDSVAVAYYDIEQGSWVSLPTDIGRVAEIGKATGLINHCSAVAIIAELAPAPTPASFVPSALNIEQSPQVWKNIFVGVTGNDVTITTNVANNGGQKGTYTAELKLNEEAVDAKKVTLAAGQSQQVTFTLSGMDYGQYEVEVAGLSGEFTVSRIIDWWAIFGIILAVAVISWAAIRWVRRKKPAQPAESEGTAGTE